MIKTIVVFLLIIIVFACMIGDVLPRTAKKAQVGDIQATWLLLGGVIAVLLVAGALLIILTTITGGAE